MTVQEILRLTNEQSWIELKIHCMKDTKELIGYNVEDVEVESHLASRVPEKYYSYEVTEMYADRILYQHQVNLPGLAPLYKNAIVLHIREN